MLDDRCVICGSEHKPIDPFSEEDGSTDRSCRDRAGHIHLSFGYGSRLDLSSWVGVICDYCADVLVKTAAAPFTEHSALGLRRWRNTVWREEDDHR